MGQISKSVCHCGLDAYGLLYFIKFNVHTSIARTWISQWFLAKKIIFIFQE